MLEMKKRTNYLSIYPCISVLREGIAEPSIEREGENVSIKEQGTDVTIKGKGVYYFIKGKGADVSINIRRVDTDFNYQAYVSIKRIEADLSLEWRKLYISIEG